MRWVVLQGELRRNYALLLGNNLVRSLRGQVAVFLLSLSLLPVFISASACLFEVLRKSENPSSHGATFAIVEIEAVAQELLSLAPLWQSREAGEAQ